MRCGAEERCQQIGRATRMPVPRSGRSRARCWNMWRSPSSASMTTTGSATGAPAPRTSSATRPTDVLAKPGAVLFAEPSADEPDACSRMAERGRALGYWRGRLPARHRDGTDFDCGFRVFPVTGVEGRSVVMALASRGDELDRVKTNLAFLDALFETCPIGLVMLDEDLRYVHLNQALADMNGLPIAEHIGRRLTEIMITSEGGEYERMLRTVVAGGPDRRGGAGGDAHPRPSGPGPGAVRELLPAHPGGRHPPGSGRADGGRDRPGAGHRGGDRHPSAAGAAGPGSARIGTTLDL